MGINHYPSKNTFPSGHSLNRPSNPSIGDTYNNGTLGRVEIYTSNGWMALNAAPKTPTSIVASNAGTNRGYNNGSVSISITPDTIGGLPTLYTATSSPGSYVGTSTTPEVVVTGLQSSTQYSFSVVASNDYATANSISSNAVTATTVPQAPTIGIPSNITETSISVPFTTNATGGEAITSYTVTSSPGNISASGTSSPIEVTGLTNGTTYTFSVTATNSNGTSAASQPTGNIVAQLLPPPTVEYLVVGAGANSVGGGGNVLTSSSFSVQNATNYTLTVGAGGGNASVFASVTSNGGNGSTSGSGKSGGGGGGCNGGSYGGSGGGAGTNGSNGFCENAYTNVGGSGGAGLSSTITGSTEWFGGGGGGHVSSPYNCHLPHRPGSGGIGGGGSGSWQGGCSYSPTGSNGGVNTGGGAGNGALGGSGIVKIAYPNQYKLLTVSPGLVHTVDTSTRSGYRIYTFTGGTGTVNF